MIFWLSFSGYHRFLGGCFIVLPLGTPDDNSGMREAVQMAHRIGINPGGEVLGVAIPIRGEKLIRALAAMEPYLGRLLKTKEECIAANAAVEAAVTGGPATGEPASYEEILLHHRLGHTQRVKQEDPS